MSERLVPSVSAGLCHRNVMILMSGHLVVDWRPLGVGGGHDHLLPLLARVRQVSHVAHRNLPLYPVGRRRRGGRAPA